MAYYAAACTPKLVKNHACQIRVSLRLCNVSAAPTFYTKQH
jgi:hypothetical protein